MNDYSYLFYKVIQDDSNPPKGYYRRIISDILPSVRIAFTHTPIHGCTIIDPTDVLHILDDSKDSYAKFYADGIRNGNLVAIVEGQSDKVFKNNGELFFTS